MAVPRQRDITQPQRRIPAIVVAVVLLALATTLANRVLPGWAYPVCGTGTAAFLIMLAHWSGLDPHLRQSSGCARNPCLLWLALIRIPLGTVVLEEVAFRGVLPALFGGGERWKWTAVLGAAAAVIAIGHLSGRWWTLLVGILSALWSGSFVVLATQSVVNSVWGVPYAQRPGFGEQLRRSLFALSATGLGLVVSTVISSYVTGTNLGIASRLAGYLIAIALDVGLFIVAFRVLTKRDVATRGMLPGALLSGIVFWLLQQLSSLIISGTCTTPNGSTGISPPSSPCCRGYSCRAWSH